MYITTSRKPSDATRVLARNISSFLNGTYENRGKKSIEDIVSRARSLGFRRIIVINETKGNPNKLAFIKIDDNWDWMTPEIIFSITTQQLERIGRIGKEVVLHSEDSELANLFEIPKPTTDDTISLSITHDAILFSYGKKKLLLNIKDRISKRSNSIE